MIAWLKGAVKELTSDSAILDVSGVGYELTCSSNTLSDLSQMPVGDVELFVHTHVREDALLLYGFSSKAEKQMFHSLLQVNGIGPKLAVTILSGARLETIVDWIERGDAKSLTGLPKVGKKTAEQIILELKGKLVILADEEKKQKKGSVTLSGFGGTRSQVFSALVNLGFRAQEVEEVVAKMDASVDVETGVREGLQLLTSI